MNTYEACVLSIRNNKERLSKENWNAYDDNMQLKLDIFLLVNRITHDQYERLMKMLHE